MSQVKIASHEIPSRLFPVSELVSAAERTSETLLNHHVSRRDVDSKGNVSVGGLVSKVMNPNAAWTEVGDALNRRGANPNSRWHGRELRQPLLPGNIVRARDFKARDGAVYSYIVEAAHSQQAGMKPLFYVDAVQVQDPTTGARYADLRFYPDVLAGEEPLHVPTVPATFDKDGKISTPEQPINDIKHIASFMRETFVSACDSVDETSIRGFVRDLLTSVRTQVPVKGATAFYYQTEESVKVKGYETAGQLVSDILTFLQNLGSREVRHFGLDLADPQTASQMFQAICDAFEREAEEIGNHIGDLRDSGKEVRASTVDKRVAEIEAMIYNFNTYRDLLGIAGDSLAEYSAKIDNLRNDYLVAAGNKTMQPGKPSAKTSATGLRGLTVKR